MENREQFSITPNSIRCHIALFGSVNTGKSSLINKIANQEVSIVSDVEGTTTDAVKKSMEILPLGPVVLIDTAGLDDETLLGQKRLEKTKKVLESSDIALLVLDINKIDKKNEKNEELIEAFKERKIPYLIIYNKSDLYKKEFPILKENEIIVSAKMGFNIEELKEKIANLKNKKQEKFIIKDKLNSGDIVVLCVPIDSSAPKGRLIMPQQLVIREILDKNAICIISQDTELKETLNSLKTPPKMVITDSQVFNKIKDIVPKSVILTSFSILFANFKGNLEVFLEGAQKIDFLKDKDTILISEACTHHRQCEDIGTVKLPKWLSSHTKKELNFEFTSGQDFPQDLEKYSLIIHCGGCMINEAQMKARIEKAQKQGVKITNYGFAIAHINNILNRSLEVFKL